MSNLELPWCNLRPSPLVLSLTTWERPTPIYFQVVVESRQYPKTETASMTPFLKQKLSLKDHVPLGENGSERCTRCCCSERSFHPSEYILYILQKPDLHRGALHSSLTLRTVKREGRLQSHHCASAAHNACLDWPADVLNSYWAILTDKILWVYQVSVNCAN